MDAAAMISEIQDAGFQGTSSSRLLSYLNQTYQKTCAAPYPFLLQSVTFTQPAGQAQVTGITPTGGTLRAIKALVNTTYANPLKPMRQETLAKNYATALTEQGTPYFYYFVGKQIYLYQVPSAPVTLNALYTIRPTDLDLVTNTTPILPDIEFCELLISGALEKAYAMQDDTDLAPYWNAKYKENLATLQEALWMQQYDRPNFVEDVMSDNDWLYD